MSALTPPKTLRTPPKKTKLAPEEAEWMDESSSSPEDPVGDWIAHLLNAGAVPHFGRPTHVDDSVETKCLEEGFSWPLLSRRNYRALKQWIWNLCTLRKRTGETLLSNEDESLWFFLETFVVVFVTIYSFNDVTLRFTGNCILQLVLGLIFTIVDWKDIQCILLWLTPKLLQIFLQSSIDALSNTYHKLESSLIFGHRYQNRTFSYTNHERISKFRRKHIRIMKLHTERRYQRRLRRKSRLERRKKEKKGMSLEEYDHEKLREEQMIKSSLDGMVEELRRRPPTYFSNVMEFGLGNGVGGGAGLATSDMTKRHLQSLQYCHHMIFNPQKNERGSRSSMSMKMKRQNSSLELSPRVAIEVNEFPDIHVQNPNDAVATTTNRVRSDSVSTTASKYSLPSTYDFDEEEDHYNFDSDSSSSSHSSSSDDGNGSHSEEEDDLSQISYASQEEVKKMDWIAVGAKIGTKILKSRQVHRVIANPSKQLIGIPSQQFESGGVESSLNASFESQYSKVGNELDVSLSEETKTTNKYANTSVPKPPKHGMWTSPGSASKTTSQYGAVTLPDSDLLNLKYSGRKVFASSTTESVELMRESSDGKTRDKSTTDVNGCGSSSSLQRLGNPYNLRLVSSTPTKGSFGQNNNTTPKASNQATGLYTASPRMLNSLLSSSDTTTRLAPMEKGVKIVVPMFAPNANINSNSTCSFQMGTVISSSRILVSEEQFLSPSKKHKWNLLGGHHKDETNCLTVKLVLDKAILRGGKFAEMNIRIMDEWNWVPRFSKYPIGSCVATTFGIGVLVGWRVEDDMHIIRSLWNRSGPGSGMAYLRRECIHSIVEAAVGFGVETRLGLGTVEGYVRGGEKNTDGKYFVHLKSKGRYQDRVVECKRNQILSCPVAKFIPVTEHIRAAALYQLETLHFKAKLREHMLNDSTDSKTRQKGTWRKFSEYVDLFAASLSKAIAEDPDFDREVDKFISHIIHALDDSNQDTHDEIISVVSESMSNVTSEIDQLSTTDQSMSWNVGNVQDIFTSFFAVEANMPIKAELDNELVLTQVEKVKEAHDSLAIILRVLLRTVAVAKTSVPDRPKLHIALAMIHEGLLFIRQVIRVNKNNISKPLIEAWFRTVSEISKTFGPLKQRTEVLGKKIAKKMKKHSDTAKKRVLCFVDKILGDTLLLHALERGDWRQSLLRVEYALVKASITDEVTCGQLHKGAILLYKNLAPRKRDGVSKAAARRTEAKAMRFAKFMKILASPGRSFLRLLAADDVLELFGRVLLRVFSHDPECSMMINIYAFNFESLRYLRTLNNMAISAKLWGTILDAIDEELSFILSEIPEQTKYFVEPLIKLFSLGVAKFHCIQSGDSNADWLEFLLEEDAVKLIHEIDLKIIDCLDAFCKDVKQLVEVMPYIKTFDNDVLDLMDELDFDLMFKEITSSICDPEKFTAFMTERTALLVERFLDYLPRMSIPIEKRELQDGWVLTCRGADGGDLRLSDINVKRENLLCRVLGSENVFKPLGKNDYIGSPKKVIPDLSFDNTSIELSDEEEYCVLDEVRDMITSAQSHECWVEGFGGVREPYYYSGVPSQLEDLPLSDPVKTGIDLWQSSAITDFEFTQIVIREVSSNIELHTGDENPIGADNGCDAKPHFVGPFKPFNPKIDATVLLLEIKNLTLHLDEFTFRVEKGQNATIFDPVFEGAGSLTVKNVCISLKVEVKKAVKIGSRTEKPVFQLEMFDISLEKISIMFKETGADWVLNTILKGFRDQITQVVQENVKEQIKKQVQIALQHLNDMFDANPDLLLTILGTNLDDLPPVQNDVY